MAYLTELGFVGLFISAFLAATILPLSSEVVLSALFLNEFNPVMLWLVATTGNVLGSVVNYYLGYYGSDFFSRKFSHTSSAQLKNTRRRYEKWGSASLLFAWVPVIGDPLTVIAGALKVNMVLFLLLVTLGKGARYAAILYGVSYF